VTDPQWCTKITVAGHRGEQNAYEDTIRALRADRRQGVDFENDVWNLASRDGVPNAGPPVVIHDPTLRRTVDPATLNGLSPDTKIGDVTPQQWAQLRTNGGQPLPTLHALLYDAARWGVCGMVQVKYTPNHPEQIASWARKSSCIVFYGSPSVYNGVCYQTAMAAMQAAGMEIGLKVNPACPSTLSEDFDFGYSFVIGGSNTAAYVSHAHRLGLKVGNYNTANHQRWAALVEARVDYLIVPHTLTAQRWLGRHR
jgi:glycerophosphoryl diester phosphodiesterase